MTDTDPPQRTCAVCARVLNVYTDKNGADHWIHGLGEELDHPAIPVEQDQVHTAYRCDFCYVDGIAWVVPVRTFRLPDAEHAASEGDWSACADCGPLIDSNRWTALLRRVIGLWEEHHGVAMPEAHQRSLGVLYRALRKNMTGSLRPFTQQTGGEPR